MPSLSARVERWPLKQAFVISRGAKTEAAVVVAEIIDGPHRGRGEAVPYARYGETIESVAAQIEATRERVESGTDRANCSSSCRPALRATPWTARSGIWRPSARGCAPGRSTGVRGTNR